MVTHPDSVEVTTNGFSIESLAIVPKPLDKPLAAGPLGLEHEPASAVHFRHWEHNAGEAPLGNSPVAISLHGEVQTRVPLPFDSEQANVSLSASAYQSSPARFMLRLWQG